MAKNRKEAEKVLLTYIEKLGGKDNRKLYEDRLKELTDSEFDSFIQDLKDGKQRLSLFNPNGYDNTTTEKSLKVCKELNVPLLTNLSIGNDNDNSVVKTPNKVMVWLLPFKRVSQTLIKKISIPENNYHIDMLTGQVTNDSKGATLTFPEIQLLVGMGMKDTLTELLKYRGGDIDGQAAMDAQLQQYGTASQEVLKDFSTGVISTKTFKAMLLAMHLKSTL